MNKKRKLIDPDRLPDALRKAGIKPTSVAGIPLRPVAEAVEMVSIGGEPITGSGFKKGRWTIVFHGKVSPQVGIAQEQTELKLNAGRITTDLYLPGVRKKETAKATRIFDLFSYFFLEAIERKLGIL